MNKVCQLLSKIAFYKCVLSMKLLSTHKHLRVEDIETNILGHAEKRLKIVGLDQLEQES